MDLVDLVAGMEVMDRQDCQDLLASECVGRLVVIVDGVPEIFPVNYDIDGDSIVFRTNEGRKMRGVHSGQVAFEVDHFDLETRSGWSVVVHGHAEGVTENDAGELKDKAAAPWSGRKEILVRISPATVTGRRVRAVHGVGL